jgi:hypothetical protein
MLPENELSEYETQTNGHGNDDIFNLVAVFSDYSAQSNWESTITGAAVGGSLGLLAVAAAGYFLVLANRKRHNQQTALLGNHPTLAPLSRASSSRKSQAPQGIISTQFNSLDSSNPSFV